jgi:hypothetical protein
MPSEKSQKHSNSLGIAVCGNEFQVRDLEVTPLEAEFLGDEKGG